MMNHTQNTTIVPTTPVQTSLSVNEFEKKLSPEKEKSQIIVEDFNKKT